MSSNLYLALGTSLNPSVPPFSKRINHRYPSSSGAGRAARVNEKMGFNMARSDQLCPWK